MRVIGIVLAIAAISLSTGGQAQQRIPPWCLKASMGRGWMPELCYYWTWESCNRERFFYGPTSFCIVNPQYYFRYGEPKDMRR